MVALASHANAQSAAGRVPAYKPPKLVEVGSFPWGVDVADAIGDDEANGWAPDGFPDLAVVVGQIDAGSATNGGGEWDQSAFSRVMVYRNTQVWNLAAGLTPSHVIILDEFNSYTIAADVAWVDMDQDSRLDLVISATHHFDNGEIPSAWGVYVYRFNQLQNKFEFHSYQDTPLPVRSLAIADLDDQNGPDVLVTPDHINSPGGADLVWLMHNDGAGNLLPEQPYGLGDTSQYSSNDVIAGHFDNDPDGTTYPDFISSAQGDQETILFSNQGDGTYASAALGACSATAFWDYASGHFTVGNLSNNDIAAIGYGGVVSILHNNAAQGTFSSQCGNEPNDIYLDGNDYCGCDQSPASPLAYGIATGQLNGGTKIDVVATGDCSDVRLLLGNGDGTFEYNCYDYDTGAPRLVQVLVADMDQDGFNDIVSIGRGTVAGEGKISILISRLLVTTTP